MKLTVLLHKTNCKSKQKNALFKNYLWSWWR
jgi:hypothetical protein